MKLNELTKDRQEFVRISRKNNFEEGIKRLLTEMYPDNAHFIYELLQNAEDPGATTVKFILGEESIEFEHNAPRLFSLKDVNSITSIGDTTKRDDPTAIGKFGVGFKAVFAYTNTPEIHSGDFHFRIRDLVVPETEGVQIPRIKSNETRFIFPFDNEKKSKKRAVEEIEKGLRSLAANTLLFLTHISKIEYLLPDGSFGSIERKNGAHGRIEIQVKKPDGTTNTSHWLRFQKDVNVTEDDKVRNCNIAVAYCLVEDQTKESKSIWKIIPLEKGEVSIFFPAEKETSNLRIHIHAPFASTVARDSVRNTDGNYKLRDHIASLIVESLEPIRDQGFLTVGFLATLPNPSDNLPEFYEPIRMALISAFQKNALTPTKSGEHALSVELYKGPSKILEVLDDSDLSLLTGFSAPLWAANASQVNQREDKFLQSLEIDEFSWSKLRGLFFKNIDDDKKLIINSWIASKSDDWLLKLYALLGEVGNYELLRNCSSNTTIVRVNSIAGDYHVIPSEAFFAADGLEEAVVGINYVKPEVYAKNRSDHLKLMAQNFLTTIGVRPFNQKTEVEIRLKKYAGAASISFNKQYYEDIKLFVAFWKAFPDNISIFGAVNFLIGHKENKKYGVTPQMACIDNPYIETNLAAFTEAHGYYVLGSEYLDNIPKKYHKDLIDYFIAIGVNAKISVSRSSVSKNPNWNYLSSGARGRAGNGPADDYTISNLEIYLNSRNALASSLVWNALISASASNAFAMYQQNSNCPLRKSDSQLVLALKNRDWIPDKDGNFHLPSSISSNQLPKNFIYDDRNGLLTAIGFGLDATKRSEEYQTKDRLAKENGLDSAEELDAYARAKKAGVTQADIEHLIATKIPVEQPVGDVPNPERRRRQVLEKSADAPSKESVKKERSIQIGTSQVVAEAKAYLRANYTNANRQMVCQCCTLEMPFKFLSGEYYFEAVQCIPSSIYKHFQNRLALCPLCAAMYQYARETKDEDVIELISQHEANTAASFFELPVSLAGKNYRIRFVPKHLFDLHVIMNK